MAVTSSSKTMLELLERLRADYPTLTFVEGESFYWSPADRTVTYYHATKQPRIALWALLHEAGHALLGHTGYDSDFELMQLEVGAWQKAKLLGKKYQVKIDTEHIEDCLDTYRDWLHRRSTCPTCRTVSVQKDKTTYECFNCHTVWHVTASRFCRPYRRLEKAAP
jgi:hypothetical protein